MDRGWAYVGLSMIYSGPSEYALEGSDMKCKHCQQEITFYAGRLWHDDGLIFPQYCETDPEGGSQLHEPEEAQEAEA